MSLKIQDIFILILKSVSFGMIISIVAITEGLSVERASTEVPVAGLKAVSNAFAACIVLNIILSAMYHIVLA
jgi:phospholipid/cholesterol/gamma-HCH transport system permease protein